MQENKFTYNAKDIALFLDELSKKGHRDIREIQILKCGSLMLQMLSEVSKKLGEELNGEPLPCEPVLSTAIDLSE